MEYVAYMVSISVFLLVPFELRRGRLNSKQEVEDEIFARYFGILTELN